MGRCLRAGLGARQDHELGRDPEREARRADHAEGGPSAVDVVDDERDKTNGHQDDDEESALYDGHGIVIGAPAAALKAGLRVWIDRGR